MLLAKLVTNKKVNTNRGSSMKSFNEIIYDVTKFGRKIKTSDYMGNGKYPIIDQGKNLISGYTNEENGIFVDVPAIIFGDHTRILKYIDTPFFLGADGTKILKAKNENCNLKFIYYALKNIKIPDTGYNRHYKWLKESSIIYPAIEHQDKIVNILDRITSIITLKKQQLVFLEKLKHSLFVEMFGDTVINPLGWEEHKLEEYIDFLTSGSRGWAKYFVNEENELFLTIKNVKNNKIVLDDIQYIKAPKNKEAERTKVKCGDLLISITADLGRTGVIDKDISSRGAYINQHLSLVRLDQNRINPQYISYYLETDAGKRQFCSKNQNGVKAGLNFDAIKSLNIIVPPIELQDDFVKNIYFIDKHKSVVQKSLDETQLLFDSLMQKYFG